MAITKASKSFTIDISILMQLDSLVTKTRRSASSLVEEGIAHVIARHASEETLRHRAQAAAGGAEASDAATDSSDTPTRQRAGVA